MIPFAAPLIGWFGGLSRGGKLLTGGIGAVVLLLVMAKVNGILQTYYEHNALSPVMRELNVDSKERALEKIRLLKEDTVAKQVEIDRLRAEHGSQDAAAVEALAKIKSASEENRRLARESRLAHERERGAVAGQVAGIADAALMPEWADAVCDLDADYRACMERWGALR